MGKITLNSIKKLTPADVGKMKAAETKHYLEEARNMYQNRVSKFPKKSDIFYSYAQNRMDDYYKAIGGMKDVNSMSVNGAKAELLRLNMFFNSKSATRTGTYKIMREQDIRIFGEVGGEPLQRMSARYREAYWDIYDEFKKQNPNWRSMYQSGQIQQYLGSLAIKPSDDGHNMEANPNILDTLKEYLDTGEMPDFLSNAGGVESGAIVYSKSRNNRKKKILK